MSLFDVGIQPAVAQAAGTSFADGVKSSTLLPGIELALSDGLISGLNGAAPQVASNLKDALVGASHDVGLGLGTGATEGIAPALGMIQREVVATRQVILAVGGAIAGVMAGRLLYDLFARRARKRKKP